MFSLIAVNSMTTRQVVSCTLLLPRFFAPNAFIYINLLFQHFKLLNTLIVTLCGDTELELSLQYDQAAN